MAVKSVPAALALALALLVGVSSAEAADKAGLGLEFVGPEKISLHPAKDGSASQTVTLRNAGPAIPAGLAFFVVSTGGARVTTTKEPHISGFAVRRFKLKFVLNPGQVKVTGHLVARAPGTPPAVIAFELSPKDSPPSWVAHVIFIPLFGALLFVTLAYLIILPRCGLGTRLGPVEWDFSKSWAANLTVFSALLGTVLAAGVLPKEASTTTTATYAGLNVLFGIGVLLGPFLYSALQTPEHVNKRGAVKEPQYQGRVWAFLVATVVLVWAVVGELATVGLLFGELRTANSMPDGGLIVFEVLVGMAAVSLLGLILVRMHSILQSQCAPARKKARKDAHRSAITGPEVEKIPDAEFEPPLESWTLY